MTSINLIWAQTINNVIGHQGTMPWHVPEDLKHFREKTRGFPVIMGRTTWQSLPKKFRPLPGRSNIVLTRDEQMQSALQAAGAQVASTVEEALIAAAANNPEQVWVMGGAQIYDLFIAMADRCEVTQLNLPDTPGDTFAPDLGEQWHLHQCSPDRGWHTSSSGVQYRFETYIHPAKKKR